MHPEEIYVDHDDLFTGPSREHVVGAKAATLILRGVITTGQPPDAPSRRQGSSRSSTSSGTRTFGSNISGSVNGGVETGRSGNTTPTATTPTHLSERMAALFARIPTPSPTPSPENSNGSGGNNNSIDGQNDDSESKENHPPPSKTTPSGIQKAKDKRIGPHGPRPMMRRVVSATGVGLGVRGRGLAGKFASGAGARGRAVSASATLSGMGASGQAARRRSSRLMNLYSASSSEIHGEGSAVLGGDDDIDIDNDNERAAGGQVPPSKKAKKMR